MTNWLTTKEAAAHAGRHLVTVQRAAESGALHGHQPARNCSWRFTEEAVDAWIRGEDGVTACGCRPLKIVKKRAS